MLSLWLICPEFIVDHHILRQRLLLLRKERKDDGWGGDKCGWWEFGGVGEQSVAWSAWKHCGDSSHRRCIGEWGIHWGQIQSDGKPPGLSYWEAWVCFSLLFISVWTLLWGSLWIYLSMFVCSDNDNMTILILGYKLTNFLLPHLLFKFACFLSCIRGFAILKLWDFVIWS